MPTGQERPAASGAATREEIRGLIAKLGHTKFAERTRAQQQLEQIGVGALDELRQAVASAKDLEIKRRAKDLIETIENSLPGLLLLYRSYELPLPTKDMPLVRFYGSGRTYSNGKMVDLPPMLGFLLPSRNGDNKERALVGTMEIALPADSRKRVVATNGNPPTSIQTLLGKDDDSSRPRDRSFFLHLALHCKSIGWDAPAGALFEKALKHAEDDNRSPRSMLASDAWGYWWTRISERDSGWKKISGHFERLLAEEKTLVDASSEHLLKSMKAALIPSNAKPGSVAALIDDLMDQQEVERGQIDVQVQRVLEKGFEAVPELIDHLDDIRLTRRMVQGFNNFRSFHQRIQHVVSDILKGIAGEELGKGWLRRQQGYAVDKADALAWWERAKKSSEEKYVLDHVLRPTDATDERAFPNSELLFILQRKYPKHLPTVYKTILDDRPHMQSWPVARYVAQSSLRPEEKVELFAYACRNKTLEHRRAALWELKRLDSDRFVPLLVETLKSLPKTPSEPYWRCREATFASLVGQTNDVDAWGTLESVTKRSDVGLRMEMLANISYSSREGKNLNQRITFIVRFLVDKEVRHAQSDRTMYEGPYAGSEFPRIEVRNFAARQLAWLLKIEPRPDKTWTDEQWLKFREQVSRSAEEFLKKNKSKDAGSDKQQEKIVLQLMPSWQGQPMFLEQGLEVPRPAVDHRRT